MPKLKWDDAYDLKKKQIADMKARGIIKVDSFGATSNGKLYIRDDDPLKWTDAEVQEFYEHNITEAQVEEYEATIADEEREVEEAKQREENYRKKRPVKDAAYNKKIQDLYNEHMSADEREAKVKEIQEELEYAQLKYDKGIGRLTEDSAIERFEELEKKYCVKDYEELLNKQEKTQRTLDMVNKKLSVLGKPKKPGFFADLWNRIQRIGSGKDTKAVRDYKEYTRLYNKKQSLVKSIAVAKTAQDTFLEEHPDFHYEKVTEKVEVTPLDLAKDIVKKTIAHQKGKVELSNSELTAQAQLVMETDIFKAVAAEFGNKLKYVKPDVFASRFRSEEQKAQEREAANKPAAPTANTVKRGPEPGVLGDYPTLEELNRQDSLPSREEVEGRDSLPSREEVEGRDSLPSLEEIERQNKELEEKVRKMEETPQGRSLH